MMQEADSWGSRRLKKSKGNAGWLRAAPMAPKRKQYTSSEAMDERLQVSCATNRQLQAYQHQGAVATQNPSGSTVPPRCQHTKASIPSR